MRVRIISTMPDRGYSGGRVVAITFAEALASAGVGVEFLFNTYPEMYDEFRDASQVELTPCDLRALSPYTTSNVDTTIIIPRMGDIAFHSEATRAAIESSRRVVLVNFESPNWFNSLSPVKRSDRLWDGWRLVSKYADLILSISKEGNHYAKEYYTQVPDSCRFAWCHPAINSRLADMAMGDNPPQPRVVMLSRIDAHKGFDNLRALLTPSLRGFHVQVHIGSGRVKDSARSKWGRIFKKAGMGLSFEGPVCGLQKYKLLKSSRLLYFPTFFEGFGLPPLEAAYCGLPCACSDLPVLREFGGSSLYYGDPSNVASMRTAIEAALNNTTASVSEHARIREIGSLEACGIRLRSILQSLE